MIAERAREEILDSSNREHIKNLMEGLQVSADRAMDLLKIPAEQRTKYVSMLEEADAGK